ncbi:MAG TPA: hypothetical protein VNC13_09905 [Propionibacteriaceae bacterium]|nr:hypothetical protein [Propionibacteriaceae bacterium]
MPLHDRQSIGTDGYAVPGLEQYGGPPVAEAGALGAQPVEWRGRLALARIERPVTSGGCRQSAAAAALVSAWTVVSAQVTA